MEGPLRMEGLLRRGGNQRAHASAGVAVHSIDGRPMIADSYHWSRYNPNTGRLTEAMFRSIFDVIAQELG